MKFGVFLKCRSETAPCSKGLNAPYMSVSDVWQHSMLVRVFTAVYYSRTGYVESYHTPHMFKSADTCLYGFYILLKKGQVNLKNLFGTKIIIQRNNNLVCELYNMVGLLNWSERPF